MNESLKGDRSNPAVISDIHHTNYTLLFPELGRLLINCNVLRFTDNMMEFVVGNVI